jgi:chaperonin cofactor prefoldin
LQRRLKYKSQNIDNQIKEQKKMIDKMSYKLEVLKLKENIMKDFVKKLRDKYDEIKSMIYQTTVSNIATEDFIIKSLSKCVNEGDNIINNADEKSDAIIEEKDEDNADDTLDEIFGEDVEERPLDLNEDIAKTEIGNDIEETKESNDKKITFIKNNKEEEKKKEKRLIQSIRKKNESIKKKKNVFVRKISNQIESLPKSILISIIKKK